MIRLVIGDSGCARVERPRRQFSGTVVSFDRVYDQARRRFEPSVRLADVTDGQGRSFGTQRIAMSKSLEGIAVGDRIRIAATIELKSCMTGPAFIVGGAVFFRLSRPYLLGVRSTNVVPLRSAS